ncbi:MAG TPA: hypothetical protein EYN69_06550 [Flavobacteriales bacterium]|nr:hypothetical protein [Flavobacteriales bacterium]
MILGGEIESALDKIACLLVGKVNSAAHQKIIQSALKSFGAKVSITSDHNVSLGKIVVTGEHCSWKVRQNIELFLNYHPDSYRALITDKSWKVLRFDLSQTLQHELIHRDQCSYMTFPKDEWEDHNCKVYASRGKTYRQKEVQEYFGSTEEIAAHAHCIMMELRENAPRTNPIKLLKNAKKIPRKKSPGMKDYLEAFDYDMNHPVMKRLMKQIVYWIEKGQ